MFIYLIRLSLLRLWGLNINNMKPIKMLMRNFKDSVINVFSNEYVKAKSMVYDKAEMEVGHLATAIIVVLVVALIAVALINPFFSGVNSANSNATLVSKYSSAFSLVNLLPLIFAAGIVVVVLSILFNVKK